MKKGFFSSSKSSSSPSPSPSQLPPSKTPSLSPPSSFSTSPSSSSHPLNLHWLLSNSLVWFLTSQTASLLSSNSISIASTSIPSQALWEIRALPGRGLSIVALQPLPPNTPLFSEPPLFVLPSDPSLHPSEAEARHAISKLDPSSQATFLDLINVFAGSNTVQGIFRTNGYSCIQFDNDEMSYTGVFELVSRTNHSCDPSARVVWDKDTRRAQLVTMKPIKAGEEVTVAWIVTLQKRKERMEELRVKVSAFVTPILLFLGTDDFYSTSSNVLVLGAAWVKKRVPRKTKNEKSQQNCF